MSDSIDLTPRIVSRDAPGRTPPPPWPAKGTPEYEERLAKMREGHKARLAKQTQQQRQEAKLAPPVELVDLGDPAPARMAPDAKPDPKKPASGKGGKRSEADLDEAKLREYLGLALGWLETQQGHEHWHREEDELRLVTVPATRCYNRLDRKLREQLQAMSDPAALVFGCVMVFGPSLVKELANVRPQARPVAGQRPQPAPSQTRGGDADRPAASAASVSRNGSDFPAAPADLPAISVG